MEEESRVVFEVVADHTDKLQIHVFSAAATDTNRKQLHHPDSTILDPKSDHKPMLRLSSVFKQAKCGVLERPVNKWLSKCITKVLFKTGLYSGLKYDINFKKPT